MPKIIVIAGQTASGKSSIALKLAKKYKGIIINADSRQIFRDFNIATAKPIPEKIAKDGTWYIDEVPHYLYGFASLETDYNIYKYKKDVEKIIGLNSKKNIFLVGGTGLYIDCVVFNYKLPKIKNSPNIKNLSKKDLQELLGQRINFLNDSDRENPRRLITLLKQLNRPDLDRESSCLYLVLEVDKDLLKERISNRIELMFNKGLENENRAIYEKYKDANLPSLNTIGFKEFVDYFNGNITLEQVKSLILTHTLQYAKRQKTWFKRNIDSKYISTFEQADQAVSNFLMNE